MTNKTIEKIRMDFPILKQDINGHHLVYLDNAATTQIPDPVLNSIIDHYHTDNANVHRGIHTLSERSTAALEKSREKVRHYIHAQSADEVIFTRGTTSSINAVARGLEHTITSNDIIVASALEHHANFVPWQQLCKRTGASFKIIQLDKNGDIDLDDLEHILKSERVQIVAITHVSNVIGTVTPIKKIIKMSHAHHALTLIDAAQSIRHEKVDVQDLDCDFLCFSGHKMMAPTGIGVLYGKRSIIENLEPVEFGGEMVDVVNLAETTFETPPLRFEAGTPNYVGAIALGAAIDYIQDIGRETIAQREHELIAYAEERLSALDGLHVLGSPQNRAGCLSFTIDSVHPFDLATLMDTQGVALRSGNQCAQPLLHEILGIQNITRLSTAFYNTYEEIDACEEAIKRVTPLLRAAAC
jgi:cysteine desulfurase / selenocysteine lyase